MIVTQISTNNRRKTRFGRDFVRFRCMKGFSRLATGRSERWGRIRSRPSISRRDVTIGARLQARERGTSTVHSELPSGSREQNQAD